MLVFRGVPLSLASQVLQVFPWTLSLSLLSVVSVSFTVSFTATNIIYTPVIEAKAWRKGEYTLASSMSPPGGSRAEVAGWKRMRCFGSGACGNAISNSLLFTPLIWLTEPGKPGPRAVHLIATAIHLFFVEHGNRWFRELFERSRSPGARPTDHLSILNSVLFYEETRRMLS